MVTEWVNGGTALAEFSPQFGSRMWKGSERLRGYGNFPDFALTPDGLRYGRAQRFHDASRGLDRCTGIVASADVRQLRADTTWGKGESLEWQSDGMKVQGWMLPPAQIESGKRYPMIVLIHGGPSGMETPRWPNGGSLPAALASRGYFVLMPNPRGSFGQGEEFTHANVDFGGGDLRDILPAWMKCWPSIRSILTVWALPDGATAAT